ncbi:ycf2 protein [Tanacetum coccineum]
MRIRITHIDQSNESIQQLKEENRFFGILLLQTEGTEIASTDSEMLSGYSSMSRLFTEREKQILIICFRKKSNNFWNSRQDPFVLFSSEDVLGLDPKQFLNWDIPLQVSYRRDEKCQILMIPSSMIDCEKLLDRILVQFSTLTTEKSDCEQIERERVLPHSDHISKNDTGHSGSGSFKMKRISSRNDSDSWQRGTVQYQTRDRSSKEQGLFRISQFIWDPADATLFPIQRAQPLSLCLHIRELFADEEVSKGASIRPQDKSSYITI